MTEKPNKANLETTSKAVPGVVCKTASAKPMSVGEDDLAKINQLTLVDLKAEDVFCFKVAMCDNAQDDRNFAPFDRKALDDLKGLYVGKTVIKDHSRVADNQVGRIYDTEIVETDAETELGEAHAELFAKVYMVKTDGNADLIKEIQGGIKKEVSTSCTPEKMVCSVCGTDNMRDWCKHWPGEAYETFDGATGESKGEQTCRMLLHGATDAYELSFVAVPAQPRAGARKGAEWFAKPCEEPTDVGKQLDAPDETGEEQAKAAALACELALAETFIFTNKED